MRDSEAIYGLHGSGFLLHQSARLIRNRSRGPGIGDAATIGLRTENECPGEDSSNQTV